MKPVVLFVAIVVWSSLAFAGNKFPGECSDVCTGNALNKHSMMEIWQIVKNVTQFEHPGLLHIESSTQASVTFLGSNLGLKLEAEEERIRGDEDKCFFMDNTVATEAARLQDAKKRYSAGTMYNALVKIVASRRCL
jgi:hypothetical protein